MAFDGDFSTYWDGCPTPYPNNDYPYPHQQIDFVLDSAHLVNGYRFATAEGECPVAWSLEASCSRLA